MHSYVEQLFRTSGVPVVALDVETTGLNPFAGDRIVEIGAVEVLDGRRTGRAFHRHLNPERDVPAEAVEVHGLDRAFLADKPVFAAVADDLLAFLSGSIAVIHNAPFDVGFLNMELARCGRPDLPVRLVIDTLETSKREGMAKRHSLDALCDRYGVDRKRRELHGALTDAELLGDVFVAMTRGPGPFDIVSRAPILALLDGSAAAVQMQIGRVAVGLGQALVRARASEDEIAAHEAYMQGLLKDSGGKSFWTSASAA